MRPLKSVLVTGGAGFIGSHLVDALIARGCHVTVLDNFNPFYDPAVKRSNMAHLKSNPLFSLIEGDICDTMLVQRILRESKPDAIAHLAAWAGVRPSLEQPAVYARNNVEGTTVLLEAARQFAPKAAFVFASSSSVYGGVNDVPFHESMDVDSPISIYAATKRAGEILCRTYNTLYSMDTWCLRFFTCYGPRQRPDLAIHKFTRLIEAGKPVPIFGDGSTYRDYCYIADCIAGVVAALERCKGYEVINLGESQPVRLDELISVLEAAIGKTAVIDRQPLQPGDVPRTFADVSRARALLDYEPRTKITDGIASFMKWYRSKQA